MILYGSERAVPDAGHPGVGEVRLRCAEPVKRVTVGEHVVAVGVRHRAQRAYRRGHRVRTSCPARRRRSAACSSLGRSCSTTPPATGAMMSAPATEAWRPGACRPRARREAADLQGHERREDGRARRRPWWPAPSPPMGATMMWSMTARMDGDRGRRVQALVRASASRGAEVGALDGDHVLNGCSQAETAGGERVAVRNGADELVWLTVATST